MDEGFQSGVSRLNVLVDVLGSLVQGGEPEVELLGDLAEILHRL